MHCGWDVGEIFRPGLTDVRRSMFYVQNPQVDDEGTFMQDLRPIDIYKPNLVLLHTGGGNLRLSFAAQVSRWRSGIRDGC